MFLSRYLPTEFWISWTLIDAAHTQAMDTLDPDDLIKIQVAHLEKEKRDLTERLRIVSKRVDHIERAFRKEERPLLAEDYELQQADDRESFEANAKATLAASRERHALDMDTKRRLLRMMDDYKSKRDVIVERRNDEFKRRKAVAQKKIDEEKAKRRASLLRAQEEARKQREEEERHIREAEEEARRREEGETPASYYQLTADCVLQPFVLKKTRDEPKKKKLVLQKKPSFVRKKNAFRPNVRNEQRSVLKLQRQRACNNSAKKKLFVVPRRGGRQPRLRPYLSGRLRRTGGGVDHSRPKPRPRARELIRLVLYPRDPLPRPSTGRRRS